MAIERFSYLGKGVIYMGPYGSNELIDIGNASALEFAVETEEKFQLDFQNPGGGRTDQIDRITAVNMNITMLELSPKNLERVMLGSLAEEASGAVTDERHTVEPGSLVPFDTLPNTEQTITVTQDPDGVATSLTAGTDYEATRAGIKVLAGGALSSGDEIGVDYTTLASSRIEALTKTAKLYRMVFDGLNEAQSGAPVVVTAHRWKASPFQSLPWIGDEFAELVSNGQVLSDPAKSGADISKYFNVVAAKNLPA